MLLYLQQDCKIISQTKEEYYTSREVVKGSLVLWTFQGAIAPSITTPHQ